MVSQWPAEEIPEEKYREYLMNCLPKNTGAREGWSAS